MSRPRQGFALIAVLWVLAIAASVGMLLVRSSRDAVGASRNRASLARAGWMAEGCAERARAAIDLALHDERRTNAWQTLDEIVRGALPRECDVSLLADGTRLDVNSITDENMRRLARDAGLSAAAADSLVDALADWRDADDTPRTYGAERTWYVGAGMMEPRNGPLGSIDELTFVRGFAAVPQLRDLLATEPSRIWLNRAPAAVLATLPGFTPEAVEVLLALRARQDGVAVDLRTLAAQVSPEAKRALVEHYQELTMAVTTEPDAWTLTSRAAIGQPAIENLYELRLVRAGARAAIVRRRQWP